MAFIFGVAVIAFQVYALRLAYFVCLEESSSEEEARTLRYLGASIAIGVVALFLMWS